MACAADGVNALSGNFVGVAGKGLAFAGFVAGGGLMPGVCAGGLVSGVGWTMLAGSVGDTVTELVEHAASAIANNTKMNLGLIFKYPLPCRRSI